MQNKRDQRVEAPAREAIKKPESNEQITRQELINTRNTFEKGNETLKKNIPLNAREKIRANMSSVKRTLNKLGVALSMLAATGMVAEMQYSRSSRTQDETSTETPVTSEEAFEQNAPEAPPVIYRHEARSTDAQSELARVLLNELAQTLREYDMGINRASTNEVTLLAAQTAVENALENAHGRLSGPELAAQIRSEIEQSCTLPDCDPEQALASAANELGFRTEGRDRYLYENIESNFELSRAASALDGSGRDIAYAARVIRPDLLEEAIEDTMRRSTDPDVVSQTFMNAMDHAGPELFAMRIDSLDPATNERVRSYMATAETNLNNERATLLSMMEAEQAQAEQAHEHLERNPFDASVSIPTDNSETYRRRLSELEQNIRDLQAFNSTSTSSETEGA